MSDETELPGGGLPDGNGPLRPARPEADDDLTTRQAYMPRFPWRWIAIFGGLFALVVGAYQVREKQRSDVLRTTILETYDSRLRPLSERYLAFRERIERWTMEAAQAGEPERWVDPRLAVSGLHNAPGLYLRINGSQATSATDIDHGALQMRDQDALVRCLGIAPRSARGLYDNGFFLTREWLDQVHDANDVIRLRVLDEQLARASEVDVPAIATMLQAQYFLLVLQQGENRRDAPVDVYLWDMREDRQLLRARIQASGILLPVRLHFEGAPAPTSVGQPELFSGGAHDCSIAAQIKALTGEPVMEVGSGARLEEQAREREAAQAAAAAAAAEAAPPTEGAAEAPAIAPEATPPPAAPAAPPSP